MCHHLLSSLSRPLDLYPRCFSHLDDILSTPLQTLLALDSPPTLPAPLEDTETRLTRGTSAMLNTTTPWCSGVSSVILPKCAFKTWLPYKKGNSPDGLTHTYELSAFLLIYTVKPTAWTATACRPDIPCTLRTLPSNLMMWFPAWICPFLRIYQNMFRGILSLIVRLRLPSVA
jgi:hypothetical protein